MPEYLAPGVFVEEIDSGSKPIESVGANTAAFVGFAKSGEFNKPIFITNWSDFCRAFGEDENVVIGALSRDTGVTPASPLPQMDAVSPTRPSGEPVPKFPTLRGGPGDLAARAVAQAESANLPTLPPLSSPSLNRPWAETESGAMPHGLPEPLGLERGAVFSSPPPSTLAAPNIGTAAPRAES